MTMRVAVGSHNPIKISAVKIAFARIMPEREVIVTGHDVPSGVSDQPMSHEEAISGARNRANAARLVEDAEYGIGIESGLEHVAGQWVTTGWVVIVNRAGQESRTCSIMKPVPKRMIDLVHSGLEMGSATDAVFGTTGSKQVSGMIGLLTDGVLTRQDVFRDTIIAAFASFRFPELYFD